LIDQLLDAHAHATAPSPRAPALLRLLLPEPGAALLAFGVLEARDLVPRGSILPLRAKPALATRSFSRLPHRQQRKNSQVSGSVQADGAAVDLRPRPAARRQGERPERGSQPPLPRRLTPLAVAPLLAGSSRAPPRPAGRRGQPCSRARYTRRSANRHEPGPAAQPLPVRAVASRRCRSCRHVASVLSGHGIDPG
jgi:hypothetical protein